MSFEELKLLLTFTPVLAYPDLHTDASTHEMGAVLKQEQPDGKLHPVAYAVGRVKSIIVKGEVNYGVTELEVYTGFGLGSTSL